MDYVETYPIFISGIFMCSSLWMLVKCKETKKLLTESLQELKRAKCNHHCIKFVDISFKTSSAYRRIHPPDTWAEECMDCGMQIKIFPNYKEARNAMMARHKAIVEGIQSEIELEGAK
jgi:hypothetical protein